METRNVTLSLPEPLLRRLKVYAASHDMAMSKVMTQVIEKLLSEETDRQKAHKRMMDQIHNAPKTGWDGKITWTRDDIHER